MNVRFLLVCMMMLTSVVGVKADDGSQLWLKQQTAQVGQVSTPDKITPTLAIAIRELQDSWTGVPIVLKKQKDKRLKQDGFSIRFNDGQYLITSPSDIGLLYGAYYLLRQEAMEAVLTEEVIENPFYETRILNHWDNLDGSVERGYAGRSLWQWEELPDTLSGRYEAYARANASIGINATVLNNVNASPEILSPEYLQKVKRLADILRSYVIKIYLTVSLASPVVIGAL